MIKFTVEELQDGSYRIKKIHKCLTRDQLDQEFCDSGVHAYYEVLKFGKAICIRPATGAYFHDHPNNTYQGTRAAPLSASGLFLYEGAVMTHGALYRRINLIRKAGDRLARYNKRKAEAAEAKPTAVHTFEVKI